MTEHGREWGRRGTTGVSFASALTFEGVTVHLGQRPVLDQLTLELAPGEVVCLLGESGSGKSTALRVAAGIQPVHAGRVLINDGVVSNPAKTLPPNRRDLGFMFQDFALFPHLTVLGNVLFGLQRLQKAAALARARAALERVGLLDRQNDYPHMLSGGQQQRLALARSVAPRPGILLLDEPFSSLDARLRETVREETLAVLRETHVTALIVTHDPEEAMLLGDRVALLRHGRIIQIDAASAIYRQPVDLEAARFFSPLTEIETRIMGGQASTPLGQVPAPEHAEGARVVVAIRPAGGVEVDTTTHGTPGRILSKREAIGTDICEVSLHGLEMPVMLRQPADSALRVGQDVHVRLNPEHVLVFPRD